MSSSNHSYGYAMAPGMSAAAAQGQSAWQAAAGGQAKPMAGSPAYGSVNTVAGYEQGYGTFQAGYPYPQHTRQSASFLNFTNDRLLKGLLIGAAATYLLTNESVQRTMIKGVVQVWSTLQGGIEEAKERFHDAEAELHHAARSKTEAS